MRPTVGVLGPMLGFRCERVNRSTLEQHPTIDGAPTRGLCSANQVRGVAATHCSRPPSARMTAAMSPSPSRAALSTSVFKTAPTSAATTRSPAAPRPAPSPLPLYIAGRGSPRRRNRSWSARNSAWSRSTTASASSAAITAVPSPRLGELRPRSPHQAACRAALSPAAVTMSSAASRAPAYPESGLLHCDDHHTCEGSPRARQPAPDHAASACRSHADAPIAWYRSTATVIAASAASSACCPASIAARYCPRKGSARQASVAARASRRRSPSPSARALASGNRSRQRWCSPSACSKWLDASRLADRRAASAPPRRAAVRAERRRPAWGRLLRARPRGQSGAHSGTMRRSRRHELRCHDPAEAYAQLRIWAGRGYVTVAVLADRDALATLGTGC